MYRVRPDLDPPDNVQVFVLKHRPHDLHPIHWKMTQAERMQKLDRLYGVSKGLYVFLVDKIFVSDTFEYPPITDNIIDQNSYVKQVKQDLVFLNIMYTDYNELRIGEFDRLLFATRLLKDFEFFNSDSALIMIHQEPAKVNLNFGHDSVRTVDNPYFAMVKLLKQQMLSYFKDNGYLFRRFKSKAYKLYLLYYLELQFLRDVYCMQFPRYLSRIEIDQFIETRRANFKQKMTNLITRNETRVTQMRALRAVHKQAVEANEPAAIKQKQVERLQARNRKRKHRKLVADTFSDL